MTKQTKSKIIDFIFVTIVITILSVAYVYDQNHPIERKSPCKECFDMRALPLAPTINHLGY